MLVQQSTTVVGNEQAKDERLFAARAKEPYLKPFKICEGS